MDCIEEVAADWVHIRAVGSDVYFNEAAENLFLFQVREQTLKCAGFARQYGRRSIIACRH